MIHTLLHIYIIGYVFAFAFACLIIDIRQAWRTAWFVIFWPYMVLVIVKRTLWKK